MIYLLEQVQQQYEGRQVLNIPALTVQQGEILGVVGASGAGKSTLLRLLAFLEAPSQGRLTCQLPPNGCDKQSISLAQRQQIVMVFQRPLLLSRTVEANIAYGLHLRSQYPSKAQIGQLLERLSLGHLARAYAPTLSGGEMQRVAMARALILQPQILLLDEPTANLDPFNIKVIEQFLREEHQRYQPTIVMVTHNIFQAKRLTHRVALLWEGQLVEQAPSEQFFTAPQDPRTQAFLSGDLIY
jgi:tungstate transport system ATP-binding protein